MVQRKPSDLTDDEWQYIYESISRGETVSDLAREFNFNDESILRYHIKRSNFKPVESNVSEVEEVDPLITQQARHDQEIITLQAQAKRFKGLYTASLRNNAFADEVIGELANSVKAIPSIKPTRIKVPKGKTSGVHAIIAHLSDLHNGEVVDYEAMGGLGMYNMDIFRWRMGYWLDRMLRLIELERWDKEIPYLHIFGDGDFISGLIHDELLKTNQVNVMDQTAHTAYIVAWCIAQLSSHFEEVYFSGTPGNHGRNQQRVEYKDPGYNWDWACYQLIAMYLKDYDNVHFDLPKRLWQVTDVLDTKWLHFHGHTIKGWAGIPYYGINRALKEMREALALGDQVFSSVAMAHFHTFDYKQIPTGALVMNGCVKGGDEYAMGAIHTTSDPTQMFTLVHNERGVLFSKPIYLQWAKDVHGVEIPDLQPVWADGKL